MNSQKDPKNILNPLSQHPLVLERQITSYKWQAAIDFMERQRVNKVEPTSMKVATVYKENMDEPYVSYVLVRLQNGKYKKKIYVGKEYVCTYNTDDYTAV